MSTFTLALRPALPAVRSAIVAPTKRFKTGGGWLKIRSPTTRPRIFHSPQAHLPRRRIKIFPPIAAPPTKLPMQDLTTIQLATLDPTGARQKLISRTNKDAFRPGDILQVRRKNGLQPFAGVLLNIRRRGVDSGILLRNTLTRVGVEMWFKLYSPTIEGFDIVQRKEKRAVRAKLYHMRLPKHDIGSVQNIVAAYTRQRAMLRGEKRMDGKRMDGKRGGKRR